MKIVVRELDLLFEGNKFEILKSVKADTKMHEATFLDFVICHRIALL